MCCCKGFTCVTIAQLTQAEDAVNSEIARLEQTTRQCLAGLDTTFQEIAQAVNQRRAEMCEAITRARDDKKRVLDEQLALIQAEKDKVCQSLILACSLSM